MKKKTEPPDTAGTERPEVRRVAPSVPMARIHCGLPELEAELLRTEGQVYTIFYLLGLLRVPPVEVPQRLGSLLAKQNADNLQHCSIAKASALIVELAQEVKQATGIDVLSQLR